MSQVVVRGVRVKEREWEANNMVGAKEKVRCAALHGNVLWWLNLKQILPQTATEG